jgi:hypothetical protein
VKNFGQRSHTTNLESELIDQRPAPRDEFVAALTRRIEARSRHSRSARIGAAIAAAGVALIALGAGGAGYAYSSASIPTKKAPGVHINQSARIHAPDSSSHAQYGTVPVPPHPPTTTPTPTPPTPPPPTPIPPTPTPTPTPKPSPGGGSAGGGGTGGVAGASKSGGSGTGAGTTGTGNVAGASKSQSGLPFTGLSLMFPVLLGAGLIALGLILRRRARALPR